MFMEAETIPIKIMTGEKDRDPRNLRYHHARPAY